MKLKFRMHWLKRKSFVIGSFIMIAVVAVGGYVIYASVDAKIRKNTDASKIAQEKAPIAVVSLDRFGFNPSEMKVPASSFYLMVRSHLRTDSITYELTSKSTEKLLSEKFSNDKKHWAKKISLPAGEYNLTALEMPEASCKIVIASSER